MDEVRKRRDFSQLSRLSHCEPSLSVLSLTLFLLIFYFPVTPRELEVLRKQFLTLATTDRTTRGSAVFNFEQFQEVFTHLVPGWQPDTPAMAQLFLVFDTSKDNRIDFRELMTGLSVLLKGSREEKLMFCFKTMDVENRGLISKQEVALILHGFMKNVYLENEQHKLEELLDTAFNTLDDDRDGLLTFDQFRQFAHANPALFQCFMLAREDDGERDVIEDEVGANFLLSESITLAEEADSARYVHKNTLRSDSVAPPRKVTSLRKVAARKETRDALPLAVNLDTADR